MVVTNLKILQLQTQVLRLREKLLIMAVTHVSDVEDQDIGLTNVQMVHRDKVIMAMVKYLENLIIRLLNTIITVQTNSRVTMVKIVLTVCNRDIGLENAPNLVDKDKEVVKEVIKQVIPTKGGKQIFEL